MFVLVWLNSLRIDLGFDEPLEMVAFINITCIRIIRPNERGFYLVQSFEYKFLSYLKCALLKTLKPKP